MISPVPDIKKIKISADDEFMILACDGIWNSLSSQQVVDFVRERIKNGEKKMSNICEEVVLNIRIQLCAYNDWWFISFQLFDVCLAPNTAGDGTGCDNMTAVIVQFLPTMLERSSQECSVDSKKRPISPSEKNISNDNSTKKIKIDTASTCELEPTMSDKCAETDSGNGEERNELSGIADIKKMEAFNSDKSEAKLNNIV